MLEYTRNKYQRIRGLPTIREVQDRYRGVQLEECCEKQRKKEMVQSSKETIFIFIAVWIKTRE